MKEKYKKYCMSLGESVFEIFNEAKNNSGIPNVKNDDFNHGYISGLYRMLTIMQQQAEIFDIDFKDLGIDFEEFDLIKPVRVINSMERKTMDKSERKSNKK